jgi:hypothetical protein
MDFRKKLLGLAGATMVFAGMANAQLVCTTIAATPGANFIRAEGQTEAIPQLTISGCSGSAGGTATVQVFLSPAVLITSAVTNTPSTGSTEAVITANTGGTTFGTITGSSINFNSVPFVTATTSFTISNIRVNATGIPTVTGAAPQAINAQAFVSGVGVTPGPTTSVPVSYTFNGLQTSKVFKDAAQANSGLTAVQGTPFGICGSINASSTSGSALVNFFVSVNENFQGAFKTQAHEATGIAPDTANSGTRIKVVFSNVPSGLNIYMPTSVIAADGAVLTAQSSETGGSSAGSGQTVATSPASVSGLNLFLVPSSAGTATAIYEITADSPSLDVFSLPVTLQAGTDTVVNQSTTMMVSTSFAPITGSSTIPSFAVGTSTTPATVLAFSTCTTTLLFPFVTNQAGFETGIAIANTSVDPFGSAKAQSGTCTLNYYGASSTVANPTKTTAPNTNETTGAPYLAGETYAFTLTSALAATTGNPATFQGYVIAACNFQFAHGFAYIVYQFPGTSSDTMGYLALSIPRGATAPESAGH